MNLAFTHTVICTPASLDGSPYALTKVHTSLDAVQTSIINEDVWLDQISDLTTIAKQQNASKIHRQIYGEIRQDLTQILDMAYRAGSFQLSEAIPQAINALLAKIPY